MFVLSQRGNGFPLNFNQMKNLPKFIANLLTSLSLTASQIERYLQYYEMWNNPMAEYSSTVRWIMDGEPINKFSIYKLPLTTGGNFLRYGKKTYSRKEEKNLFCQVVRSDYGATCPLHIGLASLQMPDLSEIETFLLSFPESFHSPEINFGDEGRVFMGRIFHESGLFSIMISGSCNEQAASNMYVDLNGTIQKIARHNRHTINFSAKRNEQISQVLYLVPYLTEYRKESLSQMQDHKGTFNTFYSRIILKGKSTANLKGRASGLYNAIKDHAGEKSETLKDFYLACLDYDYQNRSGDMTKILLGSYSQYSLTVLNYAENNYNIRKFDF